MSAGRKILFFPADRMINKGRKVPMKMHIEYDDFGWYVEANDEGTLYAVGAVEDAGDQK